jgi:soluble cytochrome b562
MPPDDTQRNSPTMTDHDRHAPALTGTDRQSPTMSATRSDKHTLTTREVMKMFEEARVPRNQRTIERYCKEGDLDCFPDSLEKRYYITPESADILIGQLQEIALRHQKGNMSEAPPSSPTADDTLRPPATPAASDAGVKQRPPDTHDEKQGGEYAQKFAVMEARIKELENENFNLEIDKRSREQVIGMMREQMTLELTTFTAEITKQSRRVGQLETEMRQIAAPARDKQPTPDDRRRTLNDSATIDAEYRDTDASTPPHHNDVSTHAPQP